MSKILIIVNRDFVLYNFRFELVERLLSEKHEVYICLPYGPKVDLMTSIGAKYIPIKVNGRGKNIFEDICLMSQIKKIYRKVKPDMVLLYTTKVDIYGGIIAGKAGIPYLLNVSGLGTAVEQKSALQKVMLYLYGKAIKNAKCVFFQNDQNKQFFDAHHMAYRKSKLIPGSGVNLTKWQYLDYPGEEDGIHFLFIARVIKEKGIEQYLETARVIREKYPMTHFHVLGPCDGDYSNILEEYQNKGIIEYHGMVQDTAEYLKTAHCTIHPSFYPEGISNVLLESAASGRPLITTDRSGCREAVEDGVTGFIVPQQDSKSLIEAVERFIQLDWNEKKAMGIAGRRKMEEEFDRNIVINAYLDEIFK